LRRILFVLIITIMNYPEYLQLFDDILHCEQSQPPYGDPEYRHYAKLNLARMSRWDKQMKLDEALTDIISNIIKPQHWIIIAEPWCGDAAHTLPLMIGLAALNKRITYDIQLRDSQPFLINDYLTGASKSIPKLIVRDEHGNDLFTWGPRPGAAQILFDRLKADNVDHDTITGALQQWYNQDKGNAFNEELLILFSRIS